MLIPLDYYRILGVPIRATDEQISQAYRDREWQKPRREYSEMAIAARNKLLARAYEMLSSPDKRKDYDTSFLPIRTTETLSENLAQLDRPKTEEDGVQIDKQDGQEEAQKPLINNPTIQVPSEQVVGALLMLQELGEYEIVLRSGIAYLNSPEFTSLKEDRGSKVELTIKENIILTLALAYLELGREQWQKGEYENAAMSGEMGYNLLTEDNLYPSVQSEIETDLYRLRPYRILELMAQSEHQPERKTKALQLLKRMLKQRQGIEGQGDDYSGLQFEQFLCFIQQLRQYLTSTEQQELFEAEAKRPSAVATYLTVYTLLARGFAKKQPRSIVKAQQMLQNLGKREDVYWEQSICALLLGQTQEANLALQKTKEQKILDLIKQHSQDSPDLLPGLCFYGEQWLHQEVLSQFHDLAKCKLTLKEYFADREVQNYLERLYPSTEQQSAHQKSKEQRKEESLRSRFFNWRKRQTAKQTKATEKVDEYPLIQAKELVSVGAGKRNGSTTTLPRINSNEPAISSKRPVSSIDDRVRNQHTYAYSSGNALPQNQAQKNIRPYRRSPVRRSKNSSFLSPPVRRTLFLLAMIWGIGILAFVVAKNILNSPGKQTSQLENLGISLNESLLDLPTSPGQKANQPASHAEITKTQAKQTISKWLESKSAAFGSEHKVDALDNILVSSLLSTWRERALYYKQTQEHREYQHEVKVTSVNFAPQKPDRAVVEAQVKEKAQHYQGGKLNQEKSYDDNLLVRYHLVRQGDKWFIQKSDVVKTL